MPSRNTKVNVVYSGAGGNHYIHSPSHSVIHYGYGARGARLEVFPADVLLRPDLFFPASVNEAIKVWPNFPQGVPAEIFGRFIAEGLWVEEKVDEQAKIDAESTPEDAGDPDTGSDAQAQDVPASPAPQRSPQGNATRSTRKLGKVSGRAGKRK